VQWTLAQGLSGLENLSLIPGFVGAAPVQNIGAYGVEMAATCDSVMAIDTATGEPREFRRADCQFSYRDSVFKRPPAGQHAADEDHRDRFAITRVRFRLSRRFVAHVDYGEVKAELQAMGVTAPTAMDVARAVVAIRSRKLPDPAVQGNAGSFFKNPVVPAAQAAALGERYPALPQYPADATGEQVKLAAGWLIEQAGWKGRGITTDSPAAVSERHALVLVNRGGATGAQLWGLAQAIQFDVADKFGVLLQPEPRIV
jgi:UDP-N-acetylmuramate dehydrogenase